MSETPTVSPVTPLEEVARRVVADYLGTKPGERFLLVTDATVAHELSDAILSAARDVGVDPAHARIATRRTSGEEPPEPVVAAMVAADVCLCIASKSIYHTNAKGRAQAAGTRGCFNAPAGLDAWTTGAMAADYTEIRKVAERLAERLRAGTWVRVTSPAGSDITVSREGREPRGWYTGIVREPGEISAFPGGEVSFPPVEGTSNGVIVFERVVTDLGRISEPIRITVKDGLAVAIEGGDDARRLRELVDGVPGGTNIAELGIGLNPAARVGDDITESKKKAGTAHFALGDNAGGYGGVVESPIHLDGMVLDATVTIDGEVVVADGEVLL
ncbi:MAG: aminopeptidase [Thermoleophilaceae bacterium]|nr:aminopeptidase [Thermoleophilaceae bacterium]